MRSFAQAAVAEQQALGWGGRPLHQQHPPQHQQQLYRGRNRAEDFAAPGFQHSSVAIQQGAPTRGPRGGQGQQGGRVRSTGQNSHYQGSRNGQQRPNGAAAKAGGGPAPGPQAYRRLWQQVTAVGRGGRLGERENDNNHTEATVEDLLEVVRHLPPEASAIRAIAHGLYALDSGALAALLKELNKGGHSRRAQEIFDWLRSLDPSHDLYGLANTMTYTTMISQCGSQQALRRALELVAEMRGRGVQCNVHTYSALMNVCIKANELDLALDVYRQMMAEGCTPNLVTYNTLIDVYGKTGAWEEAIAVLDLLHSHGIEPEVRTYNTVIIACNQSSRATEALHVYERMLAAGAQPTATTYTALISAYGKAGQLDAAMGIFQDMLCRGCERNVITYSSLISACEKAGKWELALQLFREMHAEGCRPNVVTYNSLIAACAQGAQWEKAQQLFEQMQTKGCRPDSVTFGGFIAAYDRAGLWRRALSAFEQMRSMNCRPDTVVYNTVIGALWRTGLLWAQARAIQIFQTACRQGHFRLTVQTLPSGSAPGSPGSAAANNNNGNSCGAGEDGDGLLDDAVFHRMGSSLASELFGPSFNVSLSPDESGSLTGVCRSTSPLPGSCSSPRSAPLSPAASMRLGGPVIEFGMHAFTVGSATLSVIRWVTELRDRLPRDASRIDPLQKVSLVLNKGKPSREHTYPAIRAALVAMLGAWSGPFVLQDVPQGCRIEAPAAEVATWLQSGAAEWPLSVLAETSESPRGMPRDLFFQEDSIVESRCADAYAAVRQFEAAYGKYDGSSDDAQAGGSPFASRSQWFHTFCQAAQAFGFSEEVVHDAFLLADRAMGASPGLKSVAPKALAVACLFVAARQGGEEAMPALASADCMEELQLEECESAMARVLDALKNDTASISALRVLKLFLERLGADFVAARPQEGLWQVAGMALRLLPDALCDAQLRMEPPSVIAAAVLLAGRRAAGISPFWPTALGALTGMEEAETGILATAADRAYSLINPRDASVAL